MNDNRSAAAVAQSAGFEIAPARLLDMPYGAEQKTLFSPSYRSARAKFRNAAAAAGFELSSHAIGAEGPSGEALTIDVALRDAQSPSARRAVVVASGLHGPEGFFGSAAQLALLEDPALLRRAEGLRLVLIHGLNPFGFAWIRRQNEDNVDLNRGFLEESARRPDTEALYLRLAGFLNPTTPPGLVDDFYPKVAFHLSRWGLARLKATLPTGQYEHPKGMFFGGHRPTATQRILEAQMAGWIGEAEESLVLDLHTGLGGWGDLKILSSADFDPIARADELAALKARFGAYLDEPSTSETKATPYRPRGLFNDFRPTGLASRRHLVLTPEFGTYHSLSVLRSLRLENRAHFWGRPQAEHAWTKALLKERFTPSAIDWRQKTLAQSLDTFSRAFAETPGDP